IKSGINAANNFICSPFLKRHVCLIKQMFLNLKDCSAFAARQRCGDTPSRLSPIPPPALLGCLRLRPQSAVLRLPLAKVA
ncbi:TPA: hypothetical protein ACE8KR_002166, partial [Neisseria gonorrhoeae]